MSDSAGSQVAEDMVWQETGNAQFPYEANDRGRHLKIRLNDFPDEPLYTLLVDGVESRHFDDWPAQWQKVPASPHVSPTAGGCATSGGSKRQPARHEA